MPKQWIAAIFALLFTAGAGSAAPLEYLTGILREISQSKLTVDTGDNAILTVQLQNGVKYSSTMGKVKASDFEVGDHVTVEATRDDSGQYSSKSITLNKKGSAEDKAAAHAAVVPVPPPAAAPPAPAAAPTPAPAETPRPPAPKPEAPKPEAAQPVVTSSSDPVIEKAREATFSFSETLPNYVVKQTTNRYRTADQSRGPVSWEPIDVVTADLTYLNHQDRYSNILVNGKATSNIEETGSWAEGQFANMLQAVFAPDTRTEFRDQKSVIIADHPAYRYEYSVSQENSRWSLHADGHEAKPGYVGSVWIDKSTFRVLRLEWAARGIPHDFLLDTSESAIDYEMVPIAGQNVLLPADTDSLSCVRDTTDCRRERSIYRDYKKFEADSRVTFDEPK